MMSPVLFTFQIILLVIGFGVGYLFLIKAKTQESNLRTLGEILGWTLIVATIVLEILNFSYSINIVSNVTQKVYFPINSTSTTQPQYIKQEGVPGLQESENTQTKQNGDDNDHNHD